MQKHCAAQADAGLPTGVSGLVPGFERERSLCVCKRLGIHFFELRERCPTLLGNLLPDG